MKATVLYQSVTGTTKTMAEHIADGMMSVEGMEAKAMSIDNPDASWIGESSCVIIGTPTYMADLSGKVKQFLEGCGRYGLAGKIGGAFATADYIHGGGDIAIQTILTHMMVFGMMTYSGGGSYGKPVIHLGPVMIKGHEDEFKEVFRTYGQRMAKQTLKVFSK